MNKFLNHYETLNVSNDASLETIRASYHALCKIFHPDLNPNMQDGLLMIEELTNSYEILKDSNSRQDYDIKYLLEMRRHSARHETVNTKKEPLVEQLPQLPELPITALKKYPAKDQGQTEFMDYQRRQASVQKKQFNGFPIKVAAIAIIGLSVLGFSLNSKTTSRLGMIDPIEMIATSNYVRSELAPNGAPFPLTSSYLSGYEIQNNSGSSSLYVSNSKNDNDVYLKLVSINENKFLAVRHVFIKAKSDFKIENLTSGKYEVQYLDLVAGLAGRSESFSVDETKSDMGIKSSDLSVTLRTAIDGVLKVQNVSIDEFNSLASI